MITNKGFSTTKKAKKDALEKSKKSRDIILYIRADGLWGWINPTTNELAEIPMWRWDWQ